MNNIQKIIKCDELRYYLSDQIVIVQSYFGLGTVHFVNPLYTLNFLMSSLSLAPNSDKILSLAIKVYFDATVPSGRC